MTILGITMTILINFLGMIPLMNFENVFASDLDIQDNVLELQISQGSNFFLALTA